MIEIKSVKESVKAMKVTGAASLEGWGAKFQTEVSVSR